MTTATGDAVPVQTWATGYWGDGSLKWTAHAIAPGAPTAEKYTIAAGTPTAPATAVRVTSDRAVVEVDTGVIRCRLNRSGSNLVGSIVRDGREMARDGHLVVLRQDGADDAEQQSVRQESFTSTIHAVKVEQSGPVRAVVRVDGRHRANLKAPAGADSAELQRPQAGADSDKLQRPGRREWLPFTVWLYFYAGSEGVRMIHTFVFDGDQNKDFIRGLGIRFRVPLTDEPYNRHVRLAGEGDGLLAEAVQGITGLRT